MMPAGDIINPLDVRDLILEKERDRIIYKEVPPPSRLFHYADTTTKSARRLKTLSEATRIGQQDCKDFFLCLEKNKEHWEDVHEIFNFETTKFTKCNNCNGVSRPSNNDSQSFLLFECPKQDISLSQLVKEQLNESTNVTNWRHETGCNQVTTAETSLRLTNVKDTNFIIIIVNRLVLNNQGNLTINKKQISVDSEISILDDNNQEHKFKPISVIYHIGQVTSNDTRGHYMCDVFDFKSRKWFQTSDDDVPKEISSVTKNGYIFLLKKL